MSMATRILNALANGATAEHIDEMLKPDYIPRGKRVTWDDCINWRRCDDQLVRCSTPSSYDPQSGWIYCGQPADFMADVKDGFEFVACCKRHTPYKIRREIEEAENNFQHGAFI